MTKTRKLKRRPIQRSGGYLHMTQDMVNEMKNLSELDTETAKQARYNLLFHKNSNFLSGIIGVCSLKNKKDMPVHTNHSSTLESRTRKMKYQEYLYRNLFKALSTAV